MSLATLIIKHTLVKVVGWVCLVFFILCSVGAWRAGARGVSLFFLGFTTLSIIALLNSGSMQVDSDSIRYYLPLWSYQIKWSEVKYIEIDRQGASMVFCGENKKLPVHGPMFWSGKDKRAAGELIATQIDRYGIEVRTTEKANYRLSRNTKVVAKPSRQYE